MHHLLSDLCNHIIQCTVSVHEAMSHICLTFSLNLYSNLNYSHSFNHFGKKLGYAGFEAHVELC